MRQFSHEKLIVYRESIRFVAWVGSLLEELPPGLAARSQLERASTSIPLNIAEGNGKFSNADRCRFLQIANGSAVECAACLDVLLARSAVSSERVEEGKEILFRIVNLLHGLLTRFDSRKVEEESAPYLTIADSLGEED
jgi:four helix bundle protein